MINSAQDMKILSLYPLWTYRWSLYLLELPKHDQYDQISVRVSRFK